MESECRVDLRSKDVQVQLKQCRRAFLDFFAEFRRQLDLEDPDSISRAYEIARSQELFEQAQAVWELVFGRDIHFYGVSYLWDHCVNHCQYCPGSVQNRAKERL